MQHTRIAVSNFPAGIFHCFKPKDNKKIPADKCDSYTRMLQTNPPYISPAQNLPNIFILSSKQNKPAF